MFELANFSFLCLIFYWSSYRPHFFYNDSLFFNINSLELNIYFLRMQRNLNNIIFAANNIIRNIKTNLAMNIYEVYGFVERTYTPTVGGRS